MHLSRFLWQFNSWIHKWSLHLAKTIYRFYWLISQLMSHSFPWCKETMVFLQQNHFSNTLNLTLKPKSLSFTMFKKQETETRTNISDRNNLWVQANVHVSFGGRKRKSLWISVDRTFPFPLDPTLTSQRGCWDATSKGWNSQNSLLTKRWETLYINVYQRQRCSRDSRLKHLQH